MQNINKQRCASQSIFSLIQRMNMKPLKRLSFDLLWQHKEWSIYIVYKSLHTDRHIGDWKNHITFPCLLSVITSIFLRKKKIFFALLIEKLKRVSLQFQISIYITMLFFLFVFKKYFKSPKLKIGFQHILVNIWSPKVFNGL